MKQVFTIELFDAKGVLHDTLPLHVNKSGQFFFADLPLTALEARKLWATVSFDLPKGKEADQFRKQVAEAFDESLGLPD